MKQIEIIINGIFTDCKGHFRKIGKIYPDSFGRLKVEYATLDSPTKILIEKECRITAFQRWVKERCPAWESVKVKAWV